MIKSPAQINNTDDSAKAVSGAGKKTKVAPATKNPAKPKPKTKVQVRKAITGLTSPKKQKPMSQETAMRQRASLGRMILTGRMASHKSDPVTFLHQVAAMSQVLNMRSMGLMEGENAEEVQNIGLC
jgi:hypothetical protein